MGNKSNQKATAFYCRSAIKNDVAIENQKEKLANYAKRNNIEKYEFYIDNGFSGTTLDRPALKRLIADVKKGEVATIVASEICRLARGIAYLELEATFKENNVRILFSEE
jgi:DNA invertase Pin-like site-specific DNA recombinase